MAVAEMSTASEGQKLVAHARSRLDNAYAPYSNFPVAAAVLDADGEIFSGVNVENASYGLTVCAERVALFSAIAAGAKSLSALALTARDVRPTMPCGACRQVMAELLASDAKIYIDAGSKIEVWTVGELLPSAFLPVTLDNGRSKEASGE